MINNPFVEGDPFAYDLKFLISDLKRIQNEVKEAYDLQFMHYANPFQWDIRRQYQRNTLVLDPESGNVYLSVQPVPFDTLISNTDYWTLVYNYDGVFSTIEENIGYQQGETWVATRTYEVGDLFWKDNSLYRVTAPTIEGDSLRDDSVPITINDIVHGLDEDISNLVEEVDEVRDNLTSFENKATVDFASRCYLLIGDSYARGIGTTDLKGWVHYFRASLPNAIIYDITAPGGGFCSPADNQSEYVNLTYEQAFNKWCTNNPDKISNVDTVVIQGGVMMRLMTVDLPTHRFLMR